MTILNKSKLHKVDELTERLGCVRSGRFRTQAWGTSITDVSRGRPARLVEVIEGRSATSVSGWIDAQPAPWRNTIDWGVLDMSGPYRKVYP